MNVAVETSENRASAIELREFGIKFAVLIALFFGLAIPFLFNFQYRVWPWAMALVLVAAALVRPLALKIVQEYWTKLGLAIGRITGPLFMGVVFFLVFTPVALVLKVLSKDPMRRKLSAAEKSYRQPSRKSPKEQLERPY